MSASIRAIAIVRRVVDGALIVLFALVAVGLVVGRVLPMTGHPTAIVRGASMSPTIPIGSAIVIQPIAPNQLASGDIVTMRVGPRQTIFTHRIVRILQLDGAPFLETKGDANAAADGATVPASAVIGRVTWWIPLVGFLVALLSVPIGVLFVLGLGLTLGATAFLLEGIELDATDRLTVGTTGTETVAVARASVDDAAPALRVPRPRRAARQSS